jgi:hypothetical protein
MQTNGGVLVICARFDLDQNGECDPAMGLGAASLAKQAARWFSSRARITKATNFGGLLLSGSGLLR